MYEAEEKALRDYFGVLPAESGAVPDEALERAVRSGIGRGRARRTAARRLRAAAGAAAAVLLLLFALPWLSGRTGELRSSREAPLSWGSLEKYRAVAEGDITVSSALDSGQYTRIGSSSGEKNGYSFTVDAVIADRRGMIVLYTTENRTEEKVQIGGFQLKGKSPKAISLISYSGWSEEEGRIGAVPHLIRINWADGYQPKGDWTASLTMTPDNAAALSASSSKYRTVLQAPIKLDPAADIASGKVRRLDKELVIGGQSLTLEQAYYGTTGIYLDYMYGKDNSKQLFSAIKPTITEESGGKQPTTELTSSTEMYRTDGGRTLIFENDNRNANGAMELHILGLQALDKTKLDLVVDTKRQRVLQGPDDKLSFSEQPAAKGQLILSYQLGQLIGKDGSKQYLRYGINLEEDYTDGEGKRHRMDANRSSSSYSGSSGEERQDFIYDLGTAAELPQPLTFRISSYPSPVLEAKTIRIR
ncbi:DUF4179 domain-containing protein [Paenibacillus spiritus]|uniref:DUF4179 domain-containing protein n=1 Tax=Paenibacillus spiritus TaxID=2496557 RepID=A0A5J5GA93_9BACL|nr:DUF4179 domain-containing protein [Paenibacillus spiritus]KAA9004025.1 DUF4179 domain-containing protein [Paenibacillus spiritus]